MNQEHWFAAHSVLDAVNAYTHWRLHANPPADFDMEQNKEAEWRDSFMREIIETKQLGSVLNLDNKK